jgi:hypothetical protein
MSSIDGDTGRWTILRSDEEPHLIASVPDCFERDSAFSPKQLHASAIETYGKQVSQHRHGASSNVIRECSGALLCMQKKASRENLKGNRENAWSHPGTVVMHFEC